jgi:hypothetical protein
MSSSNSWRVWACALQLWVCGCQQLIGLGQREHALDEPDAGRAISAPELQSSACESYCSDVLEACSGDNDPYVDTVDYSSREVCLAVCDYMPLGAEADSGEGADDLGCRRRNARLAKNLNRLERRSYCPAAGPGGGAPGARPSCGSNCKSYCRLYQQVCDPELDAGECERQCGGLRDTGLVDASQDFGGFPDTVQCRLAHLAVAAYTDPDAHCHHARLVPSQDDSASCGLAPDAAPDCEDYCRLVGVACSGDSGVYESTAQCLRVCAGMSKGVGRQTSGDSLACRRWRAYAALLDPEPQCPSAGPIAAGPCGDPCQSYCQTLAAGCPSAFSARFADQAACRADCAAVSFKDGYSVARAAQAGTLQCRVLQLSRALAGDAQACAAASGEGACRR